MSNNSEEICSGYNYSLLDLFIPPYTIFNTLCQSADKTLMFIIAFIRCVIVGILMKVVYENTSISENKYLYNGLITYGIINILAIIFIMFKQQKYKKQMINQE